MVWEDESGLLNVYALAAMMSDTDGIKLRNLTEVKKRPKWLQCEEGIKEELRLLEEMGTWELVERPKGVNVVGSKWVFRAKKNASSKVVRYKARLVAQGFSQVPSVDYFNTYAPVVKLVSICTVLTLAAQYDYEIHQLNVKGTYLNGELTNDEVIYMHQAPGYTKSGSEDQVLLLKKPLCGLKQSGCRWYHRLYDALSEHHGYGYTRGFHTGFFTGTGTGTASKTRTRQLDPCLSNNRIQITLFRFLFFF